MDKRGHVTDYHYRRHQPEAPEGEEIRGSDGDDKNTAQNTDSPDEDAKPVEPGGSLGHPHLARVLLADDDTVEEHAKNHP